MTCKITAFFRFTQAKKHLCAERTKNKDRCAERAKNKDLCAEGERTKTGYKERRSWRPSLTLHFAPPGGNRLLSEFLVLFGEDVTAEGREFLLVLERRGVLVELGSVRHGSVGGGYRGLLFIA